MEALSRNPRRWQAGLQGMLLLALVASGCVAEASPPETVVHDDSHPATVAPSPPPNTGRSSGGTPSRAAAPTASRPSAEVEFKWGEMDPMMMEHDDGGMARQAQQVSGVISAEASDSGIFIRYDPEVTDPARLRAGLLQANLPIAR